MCSSDLNSLVSHQNVPAGPFSIGSIPIIAGPGMIQVVTRDAMGREQLSQLPFFGSSYLLRQGLNDYSFELGKERLNYGLVSSEYAGKPGAATWRRGFSPWFTGELHAEASGEDSRAAGIGGAVLLGKLGVLNATFASSSSLRGNGSLYGLGFVRQGKRLSLNLNARYATPEFWELGLGAQDRDRKSTRLNSSH